MKLSYRNTFRDRLAFAAYHLPRNPLFLLMTIGFFLFVTFESLVPALRESSANQPVIVRGIAFIFVELLLALIIVAFWAVITVLSMISRKNKPMFCEKTITLGDDGYVAESQYGKSETRWTMVQKLARTRRYIFIYLSQDNAVVIPRRAFENSTQWDTFYDLCKQRTNRAG
jgi:hypothetical protein